MRPLKVAMFVKSSPWSMERENRNMGLFSYPVPEFTWDHFAFNEFQPVDMRKFKDYDFIFHEDAGWAKYVGERPPVVYFTFDSFLSDAHLAVRLKQALQADLVLVDHDYPERFTSAGIKARQWPYCTNDHLYKPLDKTMDVVYHCGAGYKAGNPGWQKRSATRGVIGEICTKHGWSYASGARSPVEYAASMGHAKVAANVNRLYNHRPHREFDAMACGAVFLTEPYPDTPEDGTLAGIHYAVFSDGQIENKLSELLDGGDWPAYAERGHQFIMEHHTWAIRATQLRELVNREFGI